MRHYPGCSAVSALQAQTFKIGFRDRFAFIANHGPVQVLFPHPATGDQRITVIATHTRSANGTIFSLLEPQGVHRHQTGQIDRKLQLHFLAWERALNREHWRQWRYVFTVRALSR